METLVIEKTEEKELFEYLLKEEEENEEDYPEFDDYANQLCRIGNCPLIMSKEEKYVKLSPSKEKLSQSLIDDLLDTGVFNSPVEEELSLEVKQLLKKLKQS